MLEDLECMSGEIEGRKTMSTNVGDGAWHGAQMGRGTIEDPVEIGQRGERGTTPVVESGRDGVVVLEGS